MTDRESGSAGANPAAITDAGHVDSCPDVAWQSSASQNMGARAQITTGDAVPSVKENSK